MKISFRNWREIIKYDDIGLVHVECIDYFKVGDVVGG